MAILIEHFLSGWQYVKAVFLKLYYSPGDLGLNGGIEPTGLTSSQVMPMVRHGLHFE